MISKWTSHLKTQEEKDKFAQEVQGSKNVLDRITTMMVELEDELDRSELSTKSYDTPSWAYLQADKNGYRRCLNIVKKIVDLDQGNLND